MEAFFGMEQLWGFDGPKLTQDRARNSASQKLYLVTITVLLGISGRSPRLQFCYQLFPDESPHHFKFDALDFRVKGAVLLL